MVNAYEIMMRTEYELMFPNTEYIQILNKKTKKPLKRYYKYNEHDDTVYYYWTIKGRRVWGAYAQTIMLQ